MSFIKINTPLVVYIFSNVIYGHNIIAYIMKILVCFLAKNVISK